MNRGMILLKALFLSTSQRNISRYSKDRKKRRRAVANIIGYGFLYLLLMAYCIAMCVGYGMYGMIGAVPEMCALLISVIAFVFTLFKTNGYLFNFREYDMLMSLPFEARTVAACKFLYMYAKSLPWYLCISLAMMIGYGYFARPFVLIYPVWMILSLLLPLIPLLAASFLGFLIARVGSGFRKTNLVQTILTFVVVVASFFLRFILESIFRNNQVESVLNTTAQTTGRASRIYLPAGWFAHTIVSGAILEGILLAALSVALFVIVFRIVGRSYRNINSALRSHAAAKKYKMTSQKRRSVVMAIVFKEFRRMTGSTVYLVNAALGELLALILGVVTLIIGFDRFIRIFIQNAPIDTAMLRPAIPLIVYFLIGMMATTACSPSLEGKNFWILQSLPIEMKEVYQGKMLFNMFLTVPFMAFATVCLCISAKAPVTDMALYLLLGLALCAFSTAWGCVCGIRHMRLDWENEAEVIKQSGAVAIYMLPNMIVVMGLIVLVVFLGMKMDQRLLMLLLTLIAAVLAALSYLRVMKLSRRKKARLSAGP